MRPALHGGARSDRPADDSASGASRPSTTLRRRSFLATPLAVAGASAPAAAQGNGTNGTAPTATSGNSGGGTTHTVAMTDDLVFEPADLTVAPGDTVVWETTGSMPHTVTAYSEEIPDDATYFASGGFESEEQARQDPQAGYVEQGETYEHTFETTGTFEYLCLPHEAAGMTGTVEVQESGASTGGGGGPVNPKEMGVPIQAHYVGLLTLLALTATLVFTFFLLKYGETPHTSGGS